jgi:hypothetical protein
VNAANQLAAAAQRIGRLLCMYMYVFGNPPPVLRLQINTHKKVFFIKITNFISIFISLHVSPALTRNIKKRKNLDGANQELYILCNLWGYMWVAIDG